MNLLESIQKEITMPSLFQIAACFEDFFPAGGGHRSASALHRTPLADFMLHPEKLKAWMRFAKTGTDNENVPRSKSQNPVKRAARSARTKERGDSGRGRAPDLSLCELKKIKFTLEAPAANSVKLAADFTNWNKSPLEMVNRDGVWHAVIPLAPGLYSYRFIVDGRWCDDPRSNQRVPNPFGTENSVIRVT